MTVASVKQVSFGCIVQVDPTDDDSFVTFALSKEVTPPPRTRNMVESLALDDAFDAPIPGIEEQSVMDFTQFWHPGSTSHEIADTLFGSKAQVPFAVVYPDSVGMTDTFEGVVKMLGPEALVAKGVMGRKVQVQRMTAIVRAASS